MNQHNRHSNREKSELLQAKDSSRRQERVVGMAIFAGLTGLGVLVALPALTQTTPTTPTAPSPGPTSPSPTVPSPSPTSPSPGPTFNNPLVPSPIPSPQAPTSTPLPSPQRSPRPGGQIPGNPAPSPTPLAPLDPANPSPRTPITPSPRVPVTPSPRTSPTPSAPRSTGNVPLSQLLQQGSSAGQFRTLAAAIQAAGLTNALETQGGQYTIFAPTDAAFAALPAGTLERLLEPGNRAVLARLLAYHVVPQELRSTQLRTGSLSALGGGLALRVDGGRVIVNNGSVVQADIEASNGVVHAINRVLIPPQLLQQLNTP